MEALASDPKRSPSLQRTVPIQVDRRLLVPKHPSIRNMASIFPMKAQTISSDPKCSNPTSTLIVPPETLSTSTERTRHLVLSRRFYKSKEEDSRASTTLIVLKVKAETS